MRRRYPTAVFLCVAGLALMTGISTPKHSPSKTNPDTSAKDRAGIEDLRRLDIQTTLTDKADELTKLWDNDAVRMQPGVPAEVTKAVIYENDKHWEASNLASKTLCYKTEMKDLQLAGDWAFEWGYFSYRNSKESTLGQGKVLRVMRRQPDDSWKFARVMGFPEKEASAAPMSD